MTGLYVVAGSLVILLTLIYLSVKGGHLATIEFAGDRIIVRPRGLLVLWALRRTITVQRQELKSASVGVDVRSLRRGLKLRVLGTSAPGLITAGLFRSRARSSFWLVGRGRLVTVLDCDDRQVVLELDESQRALLREGLAQWNVPGLR